jgi:MFS family permease
MARSDEARLLTPAFALAFAANFLQSLALHSYLHLPGFLEGLGADELVIGTIVAVVSVTAIGSRPFIGRLMDQRGRRIAILAGGVLNMLTGLLYVTVESIGPWLVVVRLVHGLGHALVFSSLFTYAADIVPPSRRAEGIALFGISGMIPVSVGGIMGDLILRDYDQDYDILFLAIAASAFVGLIVAWPLKETRPESDPSEQKRSYLSTVASNDLRPLWFMTMCSAFGMSSYFVFLKTFVLETGFGTVGGFFSTYAWAAILLRVFAGRLPERVGLRRTLMPALLALGTGLVLLAQAESTNAVLVAGAMCGVGHGYVFPILSALVVERARANERGTAISVFTALFDLAVLVGGPTLGAVVRGADYETMFRGAAAVVILSMLIFWAWDRRFVSMTDAPRA